MEKNQGKPDTAFDFEMGAKRRGIRRPRPTARGRASGQRGFWKSAAAAARPAAPSPAAAPAAAAGFFFWPAPVAFRRVTT